MRQNAVKVVLEVLVLTKAECEARPLVIHNK